MSGGHGVRWLVERDGRYLKAIYKDQSQAVYVAAESNAEEAADGKRWRAVKILVPVDAESQHEERTLRPASVDWLDPARESCLIDGVRYERAGWREVEVDLHGPEIYDDEYTLAAKYDSLLEDLGVGPGESVTVRILVPASPEPDKETP